MTLAIDGRSRVMSDVRTHITAIASGENDALIYGEIGTGRERVAKEIHAASRGKKPLVIVDCRSVPSVLQESTLFGYQRGSFTGHITIRKSPFEEAGEGTVILLEIGAIAVEVQRRLLRSVRERRVRAVGANRLVPFAARIIATTERDLSLLANHAVTNDLVSALTRGAAPIELPPLRERAEDIGDLIESFLKDSLRASTPSLMGITSEIIRRLEKLNWVGNVADLKRAVFRIAAAANANEVNDVVTEIELLDAIATSPEEDAPRLVYADVLATRGDPRGELIHVQCRREHAESDSKALELREKQLLRLHRKDWEKPVRDVVTSNAEDDDAVAIHWRRGFIHGVAASMSTLRRIDLLVAVAPTVTALTLTRTNIDSDGDFLAELFKSRLLMRLRSLTLNSSDMTRATIDVLTHASTLENLRELVVNGSVDRDVVAKKLKTALYLMRASIVVDGVLIREAALID